MTHLTHFINGYISVRNILFKYKKNSGSLVGFEHRLTMHQPSTYTDCAGSLRSLSSQPLFIVVWLFGVFFGVCVYFCCCFCLFVYLFFVSGCFVCFVCFCFLSKRPI